VAAADVAFDAAQPWQRARSVALRPEPFGALVYHFGNRKLSFLKSKTLVAVVEALGDLARSSMIEPREPSA
jgi:putative mycofactocin binding protein MftB